MGDMCPTVLIVDDHQACRSSARALLEADGFDVVGEATDGVEAVESVAALRPEVVLLDIQLPGEGGLAIAERLAAVSNPPAVVLISSRHYKRCSSTRFCGIAETLISPTSQDCLPATGRSRASPGP